MISLNLIKPISNLQKKIAQKCKWANLQETPIKKVFIVNKQTPNSMGPLPAESTKSFERFGPNDAKILEIFRNNKRMDMSQFAAVNMRNIFEMGKTEEGFAMLQKILTEETLLKLDRQRTLIRNYPKAYIKDKTEAKYLKTPAGLNSLFRDIALLKASYIMDEKALNALFKMDITTGKGKALLNDIGRFNIEQLDNARKGITNPSTRYIVLDIKA